MARMWRYPGRSPRIHDHLEPALRCVATATRQTGCGRCTGDERDGAT
jgi:hypothetical protein